MSVLEIEGSFEGKTTIKLSTPLPLAWHLLREIHCCPFWLWNKGEVLFPAPEEMFKTCLFLWIKDQPYPNQFSTVSWFYVSKDNCGWSATEKCYNSVLWKWKHLLAFTDFGALWAVLASWQALLGPLLPPCPLHAKVYLGARWNSDSPAERVVLSSILWGALCMGTGRGDLAGGPPDQRFSKDIASPQTHECQSGSPVYGVPQQLGNLRAAAILFSLAPALCSGLCLPGHFLHSLPSCPPSWFISVEIWEQVEDSLVSAFLYLELSLVPFVLNFLCVWSLRIFFLNT